jgi:AMP deaminase
LHSQLDLGSSEIANSLSRSHQDLTNELSAPYEVPQFPIEQLEKKLLIQRQLSVR